MSPKYTLTCAHCGTTFEREARKQNPHAKEFFCSVSCKQATYHARIEYRDVTCDRCGKVVTRRAATLHNKRRFFCSPECTRATARDVLHEKHPHGPNFGDGTYVSAGYRFIRRIEHPDADQRGYVFEHRLVAAETLGRSLIAGEVVHHRDGDKLNNAPENLEVMSQSEHMKAHGFGTYIRRKG